jgi:hypothetical protein
VQAFSKRALETDLVLSSKPVLKASKEAPAGRAILAWRGEPSKYHPGLIVGWGDTSHVCASCHGPLTDNVWPYSISNVVLQCPKCLFYNDFPALPVETLKGKQIIAIEAKDGPYPFETQVKMEPGTVLSGVERDYHLTHEREPSRIFGS